MRKILIFTFGCISIAYADYEDAQIRNLQMRVSALEGEKGASKVINPPARPQVVNGYDLFITADFLYWKATETGLPFAIKTENSTHFINGTGNVPKHRVKNPDFDWSPGFKLGIGYNMPHDGWDLYLNWTWFHDRVKTHAHAECGTIFPTWIHPCSCAGFQHFQEAESIWKLQVNLLDLELGRNFRVSKWLNLRPFIGFRGAEIDQKYDIEYERGSSVSEFETKMKNDFEGAGLRAGLDAYFGLGGGWSIYGDVAASILYARFRVSHEEEFTLGCASCEQFRAKDHFFDAKAILDLALGLQWETMLSQDRYHFAVGAALEQHVFFEQNQFMHFAQNTEPGIFFANQGDLTLTGLTIFTRFDF